MDGTQTVHSLQPTRSNTRLMSRLVVFLMFPSNLFYSTISKLLTLFCLADVCNTAVRNPVGKVKADIEKMTGA